MKKYQKFIIDFRKLFLVGLSGVSVRLLAEKIAQSKREEDEEER